MWKRIPPFYIIISREKSEDRRVKSGELSEALKMQAVGVGFLVKPNLCRERSESQKRGDKIFIPGECNSPKLGFSFLVLFSFLENK